MRKRAKNFGGKLEVWSEHGAGTVIDTGTEIELTVPTAIAYDPKFARQAIDGHKS